VIETSVEQCSQSISHLSFKRNIVMEGKNQFLQSVSPLKHANLAGRRFRPWLCQSPATIHFGLQPILVTTIGEANVVGMYNYLLQYVACYNSLVWILAPALFDRYNKDQRASKRIRQKIRSVPSFTGSDPTGLHHAFRWSSKANQGCHSPWKKESHRTVKAKISFSFWDLSWKLFGD
jgi:hypothetical protein